LAATQPLSEAASKRPATGIQRRCRIPHSREAAYHLRQPSPRTLETP
jgi:hypothetical protein